MSRNQARNHHGRTFLCHAHISLHQFFGSLSSKVLIICQNSLKDGSGLKPALFFVGLTKRNEKWDQALLLVEPTDKSSEILELV